MTDNRLHWQPSSPLQLDLGDLAECWALGCPLEAVVLVEQPDRVLALGLLPAYVSTLAEKRQQQQDSDESDDAAMRERLLQASHARSVPVPPPARAVNRGPVSAECYLVCGVEGGPAGLRIMAAQRYPETSGGHDHAQLLLPAAGVGGAAQASAGCCLQP
ncbi:hypothetical protein HaLaN_10766, partial [Haematococcus lacustris]